MKLEGIITNFAQRRERLKGEEATKDKGRIRTHRMKCRNLKPTPPTSICKITEHTFVKPLLVVEFILLT